jgi:hypothetical protein
MPCAKKPKWTQNWPPCCAPFLFCDFKPSVISHQLPPTSLSPLPFALFFPFALSPACRKAGFALDPDAIMDYCVFMAEQQQKQR